MSALMALLFLVNLLAVMPMSMQHPMETNDTQSVSIELSNLQHFLDNKPQNHVEHCSMAFCTIALSTVKPIATIVFAKKTTFSISATDLESIYRDPPKRPPMV